MIKTIFIAVVAVFASVISFAAVTVPDIFSDGAVLAKRENVPVFGRGTPGERITVKFGSQLRTATVGTDGRWEVSLNLKNAPAVPQELHINGMVIKDVIAGEVFLASGQSNMAFRLNRASGFADELKLPPNRNIRCFKVQNCYASEPVSELRGKWFSASPLTLQKFTAVGYFFAKKLHDTLNVPVGIVSSSWGGTALENWMSKESVAPFPETVRIGKIRLNSLESHPARLQKFLRATSDWEQKYQRTEIPVKLPSADARWTAHSGDISGGGICWLRNRIIISADDAKNGFNIFFGRIYAPAKVFIDGKEIMSADAKKAWSNLEFIYRARPGEFSAGEHELLVRYFISHDRMHLPQPFRFGSFSIDGKGWEIHREKSFPICTGEVRKNRPAPLGKAPAPERQWHRLYNAMIHPLIPYCFSGVIWYQGEANASRYANYGKVFSAMIVDWRKKFRNKELPFYFCQLASFMAPSADPGECGKWPYLRNEQAEALKLPMTGMAVITDAGEIRDIHPLNKRAPGERLAALALKQIYGRHLPSQSPAAVSATRKNHRIAVTFSHTDGGLTAAEIPAKLPLKNSNRTFTALVRRSPGAELEGFALCGSDGKWFWADEARIDGETVIVSSSKVARPVKIRYNWSNYPQGNLFSKAGFPAAPFELPVKP